MKEPFKKELFDEIFSVFGGVLDSNNKAKYDLILIELWGAIKDNDEFFTYLANQKKEQLLEAKVAQQDNIVKITSDLDKIDSEIK